MSMQGVTHTAHSLALPGARCAHHRRSKSCISKYFVGSRDPVFVSFFYILICAFELRSLLGHDDGIRISWLLQNQKCGKFGTETENRRRRKTYKPVNGAIFSWFCRNAVRQIRMGQTGKRQQQQQQHKKDVCRICSTSLPFSVHKTTATRSRIPLAALCVWSDGYSSNRLQRICPRHWLST